MGNGLKRVAKICGGISVVNKDGEKIHFDENGKRKGPFGCKCKTLHHKMTGDGCDECNPKLAKEFALD